MVFISSSTITTITILIIACFYHMCVEGTTPARTQTSAIPGEPKSSCKPYLVAFLQRGATINPLLWANVFKPLLYDFLPLRCSHCLPDCESTYYTSSVSATPLRRSLSLKVKRLIIQNFSWKCSFIIFKHLTGLFRCDTKNIGLTMLCKFDGDVPLPAIWSHQVRKLFVLLFFLLFLFFPSLLVLVFYLYLFEFLFPIQVLEEYKKRYPEEELPDFLRLNLVC